MPIQVSIVTPEMTTFDEPADGVVVPLIDGEKGILPGHAPMIGRLGPGELRVKASSGEQRFYVDGGFVQVSPDSVSVLTGKSIPVSEIDITAAREALAKAQADEPQNADHRELRQKAINQANAQIRIAEKA